MTIEINLMNDDGSIEEISMEEAEKRAREKFFKWMFEVGKLAGWSIEETAKKVEDPSWFFCYDDGLKPEDAFNEAKSKNVI